MWLIDPKVEESLSIARDSGLVLDADEQEKLMASTGSGSPLLSKLAGKGEVRIDGILTKQRDFIAMLFGGGNTTYPDIISAVGEAEADDEVKEIVLKVGTSPGGSVDGLFTAIEALQKVSKPMTAIVADQATSATYALIAQASQIIAENKAVRLGSVGIVATARIDETRVDITSTKAPKKRPDASTEEGKAVIREQLDAIHSLFVGAIAKGRGVTAAVVNKQFGEGAVVLAKDALTAGMIDKIGSKGRTPKPVTSATDNGGNTEEANNMDLKKLRAEHPSVYAEAVALGATEERDRVNAHLTLGAASGDMETALSAVEDGSELTNTLQAKYMAASMRRKDVAARGEDDPDLSGNVGDGGQGEGADELEARVADFIATEMGVTDV
jgi:ClpP class serine protease